MKVFLDDSDCLILDHKDFRNFSINPLWLRERVNNKQYLDQNNYQRLYEPSLLDIDIKFLKYDFKDNNLKVEFTDNAKGVFSLDSLLNDLCSKDVIPKKKPWKNEFINLPIYDFNSLNDENYVSLADLVMDLAYNLQNLLRTVLRKKLS